MRLVPQPFQPWDAKLNLAEFYHPGLPKELYRGDGGPGPADTAAFRRVFKEATGLSLSG